MFKITLYNFNKKANSTARPQIVGRTYYCSIKNVDSILTPVVELADTTGNNKIPLFNYAYIPDFKRYYFIDDISYSVGTWSISMHCDVLGTYRDDIFDSRQYVSRSASQYDTNIVDSLYLTKEMTSGTEFAHYYYTNDQYGNDYVRVKRSDGTTGTEKFFNVSFTQGCFIVGIVGDNTAGVTYYAFSNSGFNEFISSAMTFTPSDMSDVSNGIANAIWNPIQYITSVRWFPVSPFYTTTEKDIVLGGYQLPTLTIGGYPVNVDEIDRFYVPITIPNHPDSSDRPYLNLSPFRELNLYFQPFGCFPIDTTKVYNSTSITCEIAVDYCGGSCIYNVYKGGSTVWDTFGLLYTMSMDYGVQLPISSLVLDWKAGLGISALSWLKTALPDKPSQSENAWSYLPEYARNRLRQGESSNTEILDKAMDLTSSALGQLSTVGTAGSFLSYMQNRPELMAWFKTTTSEDIARFGRPLCRNVRLDNLSGFCICMNATMVFASGNPMKEEYNAVTGYLNSGVYLE